VRRERGRGRYFREEERGDDKREASADAFRFGRFLRHERDRPCMHLTRLIYTVQI
jgi:hypothetical protein